MSAKHVDDRPSFKGLASRPPTMGPAARSITSEIPGLGLSPILRLDH